MKLGLRIFIAYFISLGLSAWLCLHWINEELRPLVRQASEEALVEFAYTLASTLQPSFGVTNAVDPSIAAALHELKNIQIDANIWGIPKSNLEIQVYVTDANGIVVFDSRNIHVGEDFSQWNDVYLTLKGKYGVRSTRANPEDENTSIMHVAAPIQQDKKIIGVVTVALPNKSIQAYLDQAQEKLYLYGGLVLVLSLLIGVLFTGWLIMGLRRIGEYAEQSASRSSILPAFAKGTELEKLTRSINKMREEIEGHHYLENYVNHFTHELKSPLTAIRATNELLADAEMPETTRREFVARIDEQCLKLQALTERLLQLVRLEKKRQLDVSESVVLRPLIENEIISLQHLADKRGINFSIDGERDLQITGDPLLLSQAVHNLLENALQFADSQTTIKIFCRQSGGEIILSIANEGPHIPDYALARLGERFYSLPHPDGSKGTGLGLAFVLEITALHHGLFRITNTDLGVRSEMVFMKK